MLILMWYIVELYQISDVPFENKSSPKLEQTLILMLNYKEC